MSVEVGLLVFVGGYVSLLLTIRAFTQRRAAASKRAQIVSSMQAEFREAVSKSRPGSSPE
jgi:hypothetical protein